MRTRRIPSAVRRAVWPRDNGQCAFMGTLGRCTERGFLEFHHVVPFADVGAATVDNIQLRCRAQGSHQIVIYDNGTQPDDINAALAYPAPLANLIDDPNGRIYVGLSPSGVPANFFAPGVPAAAIPAPPQDRVESVTFPNPGTYLVICAVRGHFVDGMFGFVRVLP